MNRLSVAAAAAAISLFSVMPARADVKLPRIIADSMVVQYDRPLTLWGTASPGETFDLSVDGRRKATVSADAAGNWRAELPKLPLGKTHTIRVADREIRDVVAGDVLLCSGQSNMELPVSRVTDAWADTIEAYHNTDVREFSVPKVEAFDGPVADLSGGSWRGATQANIPAFSATAFFTARALNRATGRPVGIIHASWGGTPVESWISEEYLAPYPLERNKLALYRDSAYRARIKQLEGENYHRWNTVMDAADPGLNDSLPYYSPEISTYQWSTRALPDQFMLDWATDGGLNPIHGSHWFRRDFNVRPDQAGRDAWLRLGCLVDADSAWVNGVFVGNTTYQYPPRIYRIPAGVLRPGVNTVTVRLISQHGVPHFVPEKPYKIVFDKPHALYGRTEPDEISLDGTWHYAPGARMPEGPGMMFYCYLPEVLYDGMIAPVISYPVGGVVWYQGESNVGEYNRYPAKLASLVSCWRAANGSPQLPFYVVELADFIHHSDTVERPAWAAMRRMQAAAAQQLEGVTLIPNEDLGEWNDIHPLSKLPLGARIAAAIAGAE